MLVREHQASICRYLRYLGAGAAAEDLTQETFLAAFRSTLGPDMTNVPLRSAWLRGISRNLLLAHFRRDRTNPVRMDSEVFRQAEDVWAGQFPDARSESDYGDALRRCVEALDQKDRNMLKLRYAEGLSRRQMARRAGLSEDGVKSLLRRIRGRLADCVRRRLEAEGRP